MFSSCCSFFNCLGELISEAIWFGVFFMGRFNKKKISLIEMILSSSQYNEGFFEGHLPPGAWRDGDCFQLWWVSTFMIPQRERVSSQL